ncbi:MAG: Type 1 glutamine amidotransferase-like domain-containing protein [Deltaproteobacteria bacterium]|nr:Type 1 glutamine amidotransferase-like domain-containing protein [Deltaproteobacteria bacterium]
MRSPFVVVVVVVVVAAVVSSCAAPSGDQAAVDPPIDNEPGLDDRFLGDEPCAAASAGLQIEETAGFAAGGAPRSVVVVMGGSTEVDAGGVRFAAAANGGDVLVLRASGSTSSYTSWFSEELPIDPAPRAVATVLTDDVAAGADDAVLCRVARADAIWFAGGDQTDYLVGWPKALHESLARAVARGVALGGTSAGSMALSSLTFDAREGSLTSEEALLDPAGSALSITPSPFSTDALDGFLVDTHFSERERLGRLIAFTARAAADGNAITGIGIDEETSLTIDGDTLLVEGAGDAWIVQTTATITAGSALSAQALVAPLSLQTTWPPQSDAQAPGSALVDVDDGTLTE